MNLRKQLQQNKSHGRKTNKRIRDSQVKFASDVSSLTEFQFGLCQFDRLSTLLCGHNWIAAFKQAIQ